MGIRCADHVTPLYPQKLALASPTGGGRSVGIVRSRTKATEISFVFISFSFTNEILIKDSVGSRKNTGCNPTLKCWEVFREDSTKYQPVIA